MDFGPSCRDRGLGELGVQDDVQAAVPGVEVADLPFAEEHIPRSPLRMTSMQATGSVTARFTRAGADGPPAASLA